MTNIAFFALINLMAVDVQRWFVVVHILLLIILVGSQRSTRVSSPVIKQDNYFL